MARANIGLAGENVRLYLGLSTDAKPTENVGVDSKFRERDTGREWIYDTESGWTLIA